MDVGACRGHVRHSGRTSAAPCARLRHDQAGRNPAQLRDATGLRRGQCGSRRRVLAGARRCLARPRGRCIAVVVGYFSDRPCSARAPRPHARCAADDQHVGDRRCAAGPRRPADSRDLRLQLESARRRARFRESDARFRARRFVLRRPRDLPDRHRRLRRYPAAGDDAARANRHSFELRPSLRARE